MILDNLFYRGISHAVIYIYNGFCNPMADHIPLPINLHQAAKCQAVLPRIQGTYPIRQAVRQHRYNAIHQIDARSPLVSFPVKCLSLPDILAYIRDMHAKLPDIPLAAQCHCIVKILRILAVNCDGGNPSQIKPSLKFFFADLLWDTPRLKVNFLRKIKRNPIAIDNGKHIHSRVVYMAEHLDNFPLRVLSLIPVISNIYQNLMPVHRPRSFFLGNKNIVSKFLVIGDHETKTLSALVCADNLRCAAHGNLEHLSLTALSRHALLLHINQDGIPVKRPLCPELRDKIILLLPLHTYKAKSSACPVKNAGLFICVRRPIAA